MNGRGMSLARWGLLCALVLAVLAMHHVDAAPDRLPAAMPGVSAPAEHHPAPHQDDSHGTLLHLCLAVLVAVGGLLLAAVVLRRAVKRPARLRRARSWRGHGRGPPPRSGRDLLTLACVIRV